MAANDASFKTGQKTGRPPGRQNKVTLSVKAALLEAFERNGGVDSLLKWAKTDPGAFFTLWGRLAPRELNVEANVTMLTPEERKARLAAILSGK